MSIEYLLSEIPDRHLRGGRKIVGIRGSGGHKENMAHQIEKAHMGRELLKWQAWGLDGSVAQGLLHICYYCYLGGTVGF